MGIAGAYRLGPESGRLLVHTARTGLGAKAGHDLTIEVTRWHGRATVDPRFDCEVEAYDFPYQDDDAVAVEVPAGSVVLFNGYLLHMSLPNTGRNGLRRGLVNHYRSAQSLLPWMLPPPGVSMGRADHRDVVVVAGTDPYAYKGTADVMRPHVRPDGQGGCLR